VDTGIFGVLIADIKENTSTGGNFVGTTEVGELNVV